MTSNEKIEALLQREGFTLKGLPESDVIELLCSALEKCQKEREAAISDAVSDGCFTCKHNDKHSREEPCVSCRDFNGWEWRGPQEEKKE